MQVKQSPTCMRFCSVSDFHRNAFAFSKVFGTRNDRGYRTPQGLSVYRTVALAGAHVGWVVLGAFVDPGLNAASEHDENPAVLLPYLSAPHAFLSN